MIKANADCTRRFGDRIASKRPQAAQNSSDLDSRSLTGPDLNSPVMKIGEVAQRFNLSLTTIRRARKVAVEIIHRCNNSSKEVPSSLGSNPSASKVKVVKRRNRRGLVLEAEEAGPTKVEVGAVAPQAGNKAARSLMAQAR